MLLKAGDASARRMAVIDMVTINSTSVKPLIRKFLVVTFFRMNRLFILRMMYHP